MISFFIHIVRKLTIRQLIIWQAMLLLSGCADMNGIGTQSRPLDPARLSAGNAIQTADLVAWPNQQWWTACHDVQLDRLVAQAVAGSPRLQTARDRIALAQAIAQGQHAGLGPQLGIDASASRDRFTDLQFIPPPWAGNTYWNNSVAASLSWDLDLWGRQKANWQAALDEASAASIDAEEVRIELETAIVRSYFRLALAYARRDVARARLDDLQEKLVIERQGEQAGLATQLAISSAEDPLPLARAELSAADEAIAHLKNELAALAGTGPGAMDHLQRPQPVLNAPIGLPDHLPAHLLGRRPDISAQRLRVEAGMQRIHAARAAFYPDVNLNAMAGFQAIGFAQWLSQAALMTGAGPAISLPLFDSGRRRAGLSVATSTRDLAVDQYNETVVQALRDVADQLVAFRSATRQQEQAESAVQNARHTLALATEAWRAGLSDERLVLAARDKELAAQTALDEYNARRLDSWARLMLALGGGSQ